MLEFDQICCVEEILNKNQIKSIGEINDNKSVLKWTIKMELQELNCT